MLSCPNKNTQEWKDILAEANGNERKALELWVERGFNKDENLNIEVDDDNFSDQRQGQSDPVDPEKTTAYSKLIQDIIIDLRKKEQNYIAIDKDRVEQAKNYQIQIDGLKKEVSKKNWKLKMGKFEKVIIGVAGVAAGILIK